MSEKKPFKYKMAIVIRTDLKMSVGKMMVQAGHACTDLMWKETIDGPHLNGIPSYRLDLIDWHREGGKKVILRVDSLEKLMEIKNNADKHKLLNVLVKDFGYTELEPDTITVLAIGPHESNEIDKITKRLKLL